MKDRLEELLIKYWVKTLTVAERKELEQLLLSSPSEWIKMGVLHQLQFPVQPRLTPEEEVAMADAILSQSHEQARSMAKQQRSRAFFVLLGIAVMVAVAVAGIFLLPFLPAQNAQPVHWQQVRTADGMKTNLRLADGTEIWLNAGSTLKYPVSFGKMREVYLTGEAYFNVKHQSDRPFVIHTAKLDATVLGTEVDVRVYPDEDFSTAALISGAVKVQLKRDQKQEAFYLKPRQKIIFHDKAEDLQNETSIKPLSNKARHTLPDSGNHQVELKPVKTIDAHTIPEIAWRKNILVYENEKFSDLAKRLSRWYGIPIEVKDSALAQERFTGRADNVTLEKLLHILQMLKPFTYTIGAHEVVIQ